MDINLTLRQQQTFSQSQIQSLNILTLDNIELSQFLRDEYLENPLLDYTSTCPDLVKSEAIKSYSNLLTASDYDIEDTPGTQTNSGNSIKQHLLSQLSSIYYAPQDWKLMEYLIDCLDDNGYFTFAPEDIAQHIGTDVTRINQYLAELRKLEPAGIFAPGLSDCLIAQLNKDAPDFEHLREIISCHLNDIAAGKISIVSRNMGLSTVEVRKYMDKICRLNPYPLSGFCPGSGSYIIPDIIFTKKR